MMSHQRTRRPKSSELQPRAGFAVGSAVNAGSLYVVATPIGNLSDLSQRARECLIRADWVAAEDTRVSRHLLDYIGSAAELIALHEHNEARVAPALVERLKVGQFGAVISDAGTPAVSDPGATLVALAHASSIRVSPIPGPSAPIALLSAAGFLPGPFVFEGFLPARRNARRERIVELQRWLDVEGTHLLIFEAPHRIEASIADLLESLGAERTVVIGRELSKVFEDVHRCPLGDVSAWLAADSNRKRGEFVVAIAATVKAKGKSEADTTPAKHALSTDDLLNGLMAHLPLSQSVRIVESLTGLGHREIYALALRLNRGS